MGSAPAHHVITVIDLDACSQVLNIIVSILKASDIIWLSEYDNHHFQ